MVAKKRHPSELPILFLTEMWERFSFYLMLGLLLLFMVDKDRGGMGLDYQLATEIFGTYIAMVYLTPFIGGMLADRVLGYRRAILIGAVLMMLGHVSLAVPNTNFFYLGLVLLVAGNGFFKPNISTLLGRLYSEQSPHKGEGFQIFYVGINLGAFICTFVAALIRNKWGWHAAFGSAGIGMFIGLITFLTIYKSLERGEVRAEDRQLGKTVEGEVGLGAMFAVLVAMVMCYVIGIKLFGDTRFASGLKITGGTKAFFLAVAPAAYFFIWLWRKARSAEKGPVGALLVITLVLIPFWMNFNLYGTTLTAIAEEDTRRHVGTEASGLLVQAEVLQDAVPGYFSNATADVPRPDPTWLQVVGSERAEGKKGEGVAKAFAEKVGELKSAYATRAIKMGYTGAGPVPVTQEEFDLVYAKAGQARLPSGTSLKLVNPEIFQSINPGLVIALMALVAFIWAFLRRRGMDTSIPVMMATGMFLAAGAMLVMVGGVEAGNNFALKVSPWWLFGAYFVMTTGELCLSPIGLALVSKVAPKRLGAVMMGCFFLSIAVGNKLSGVVGGFWKQAWLPNHVYFIALALIAIVFGVVIFRLRGYLKQYIPKEG